MEKVTNCYLVEDTYNASVIINAIARALDCQISFEILEEQMVECYITCNECDVPTVENMLASIV